jgi:phospholipid N-methyltransferase
MNDHVIFLREFISRFEETGSVAPSSRWAAEAMTRSVREARAPINILEVGPGTGPVTERILADMRESDTLTVCEINPRLLDALKKKLSSNPNYIKNRNRVSFFEGPIQNMPELIKYDTIVCAIPFTNLKVEVVEDIFNKLHRLCNPKTKITFFEYIGLRKIGRLASLKDRRDRLASIDVFFKKLYTQNFNKESENVWLNLTPIKVFTLSPKLAA